MGEKFTYRSKVITADDEGAWWRYREAVERAKVEIARGGYEVVSMAKSDAPAAPLKPAPSPPSQRVVPEPARASTPDATKARGPAEDAASAAAV